MKNTLKAALLVSSALIATPVLAQQQPTPPEHYTLNSQGVDLVQGTFNYSTVDVAIGPQGQGGLAHGRAWVNNGWRDTLSGTIAVSGSTYVVSLGAQSEVFTKSGSNFIPASNNGSKLSQNGSAVTLTTSDGVIATYSTAYSGSTTPYQANNAALMSVVYPSGERLDYLWNGVTYCAGPDRISPDGEPVECLGYRNAVRLEGVSNNRGYAIDFIYASDAIPEGFGEARSQWLRRTGARAVNRAVDPCATYPGGCDALTQTWPTVTYNAGDYGGQIMSSTDQAGRTTTYSYSGGHLSGVLLPGDSTNIVSVSYDATGKVNQVTDAAGTWNYNFSDNGSVRTTSANGPAGQQLTVASNLTIGRATSVSQVVASNSSATTSYAYDGQRRLQRVTQPEGDYAELTYDGRGNLTQTLYVPKAGSGLSNLTTTSSFPASCTNPITCNKPASTTDARGAVTDYAWNGTHGGLESVTLPAPSAGAVRPQTRITYAAQAAYFKNNVGNLTASPTAIVLPVSVSSCATNAAPACVGTVDEVRQTIQYGSAGVANNLLPTVVTQSDGTAALSASVTTAYTANGDVASVDGPLPGAEDTTSYRYDTARRPVGVIGPDPDGSGSLMRRAQRVTYDAGSRPTQVDVGAVNGISEGDWNGFVTLQRAAYTYDNYGRPVTQSGRDAANGTFSVAQTSYDAAGRIACVTQRMNPAAFGSLPGSACELGAAGAYGPDRITNYQYDEAGRLKQSTSGYLSGSSITEEATYTANSKPLTLKDGAGNVSTMVYDGFDRLVQINYPDAATGAGTSSSTDLEQYGYDANSNVIGHRNRSGEVINYGYDALNRRVGMGGSAIADRALSYDNLNRVTGMNYASGGASSSNTYDALGRLTSQTQAGLGTVSYGYDLAGRRTWMSWPDGFYVAYDYNWANDLTGIRENGATAWSLAWFGYDNQGRRTAQGNANGSGTSWSYDSAGRLASLNHNLAGTANDLTLSYSYNPAGQIITRTMSNPAYAYTPGAGNTAYVNNGKNQVTNVNGNAVGYDGRQNITSIPGGGSYGYNGANELTSATVGGTNTGLSYDPGGRLYQVGPTRFLYDGQQAIGEYDESGTLLKRYVPGLDSVVTAYEGTGYTRRYLLADERGSVVSITDGEANALTTNTYDEYGQPSAANSGRFQYTGQMWLPQAQLYHYRARAYAPQLGRFMQTDPIGYGDGANVYAYVGADPINRMDPSGLRWVMRTCSRSFSIGVEGIDGGVSESFVSSYDCSFFLPDEPSGGGSGSGSGSGGGTESGGGNAEPDQERRCIRPSDGPVYIVGGGLDLSLGAGGGFAFYRFSIPSIDAKGWAFSGSGVGGLGGSLGGSGGVIDSVGQWLGMGYRLEVAFGPGSLGLSFDNNGNYSGLEFGMGAGGGFYGGRTKTTIKSSNIPLCE